MQAFIVRPVVTGLLALIIAGLWGAPLGITGGRAFLPQPACHTTTPAPGGGAVIRHGGRC